jgi:3-oxoacyl-[acyl-carrier protein] reductase
MIEAAVECYHYFGVPEVIVLNAAIDNPPGSAAFFFNSFEEITAVNQGGAINVLRVFMPELKKLHRGVIIPITSIQGYIGADWRNYEGTFEKPVGYNMSKAALMQLARSLTVQFGRYGIRACCIGFGPYDGGKIPKAFLDKFLKNVPMGRTVSRQSLKAALRFAVECPEFAGQSVLVDGGYVAL